MVFSLRDETLKAAIFIVIDVLMVFLFTYLWFRFVQKKKGGQAVKQSLGFTIAMQLFFFVYYIAYDFAWDWRR